MKKLLLIFTAVLLGLEVSAVDFQWLTFTFTDGSELSVAAENLEITYNQGNLIMKSDKVNETLATDALTAMKFSQDAAAADEILGDQADGQVVAYTLQGKRAGMFNTINEARASLTSGVYLMKHGARTVKVIF